MTSSLRHKKEKRSLWKKHKEGDGLSELYRGNFGSFLILLFLIKMCICNKNRGIIHIIKGFFVEKGDKST